MAPPVTAASSVVLLVEDVKKKREVLKVARDADHAQRLRAEYDALAKLRHRAFFEPKGLEEIGGHTVLRLEAGLTRPLGDGRCQAETLASRLKADGPPSLDFIQRWSNDLLDALVAMEHEGIDHRDLKPESLVVVERTKNRERRLAVIDFSLTGVSHDNIDAGTVGYLDPFLRDRKPRRWDLAAERYAAAVVLTELVTGERPSWGDGVDPEASDLEVPRLRTEGVDPAIADRVAPVLQRAMHRDVAKGYGTADEFRRAWKQAFATVDDVTTHPGTPAVPVAELDLSSVVATTLIADLPLALRLLGAIERVGVADAGGLSRVRLKELTRVGIGSVVRTELRELVARVRELGLAEEVEQVAALDDADLSRVSVDRLADRLVPPSKLGEERIRRLRVLLGLDVDAMDGRWPTIPATTDVCGDEPDVVVTELQQARRRWANDRPELTVVRHELAAWLTAHEGVATGQELAVLILGRRGSAVVDPVVRLRRARAVIRAAVEAVMSTPRFRGVRIGERFLVALDAAADVEGRDRIDWVADPLVEAAVALGAAADELVGNVAVASPSVSSTTVMDVELRGLPDGVAIGEVRRLRLAAATSVGAALSSRGELYHRGLEPVEALAAARLALMSRWGLTADQIKERVAARFGEAMSLPGRPTLDALLDEADVGVVWDEGSQRYVTAEVGGVPTSGWSPSTGTHYSSKTEADLEIDELDRSLRRLDADGGFVVASVQGRRVSVAAARLAERLGAVRVDLDAEVVAAMREVAAEVGADWPFVVEADAAARGTQKHHRLQLLAGRAAERVEARLRGAGRVVVATNAGLLARYERMELVDRLRDGLTHRERDLNGVLRGRVVVVPAAGSSEQPTVDGAPIPVVTAAQTVRIPSSWLERHAP